MSTSLTSVRYINPPSFLSSPRNTTVVSGATGLIVKEGYLYTTIPRLNRFVIVDVRISGRRITIKEQSDGVNLETVTALTISNDSKTLWLTSEENSSIYAWDITTKTAPTHLVTLSLGTQAPIALKFTQLDGVDMLIVAREGSPNVLSAYNVTDRAAITFLGSSTEVGDDPTALDIYTDLTVVSADNISQATLWRFDTLGVFVLLDTVIDLSVVVNPFDIKFITGKDDALLAFWPGRDINTNANYGAILFDVSGDSFSVSDTLQDANIQETQQISPMSDEWVVGLSLTNESLYYVNIHNRSNISIENKHPIVNISYIRSPTIIDVPARLLAFQGVSAGAFDITVKGETKPVINVNYSGALSLGGNSATDVDRITEDAIEAQAFSTINVFNRGSDKDQFLVQHEPSSGYSDIGLLSSPTGGGTDVSGAGFLDCAANATLFTNTAALSLGRFLASYNERLFLTTESIFYYYEINNSSCDLQGVKAVTIVGDNVVGTKSLVAEKTLELRVVDAEQEAILIATTGNVFYSLRTGAMMFSANGKANYCSAPNALQIEVGVTSDLDSIRVGDVITVPPGVLVDFRKLVDITPYNIIVSQGASLSGSGRGVTGVKSSPTLSATPVVSYDTTDVSVGQTPANYKNMTIQNNDPTLLAFKHDNSLGGGLFEDVEIRLSGFELANFAALQTDRTTFVQAPAVVSTTTLTSLTQWTQVNCGFINSGSGGAATTGITIKSTAMVNNIDFQQGVFFTDGDSQSIVVEGGATLNSFNIRNTFIGGSTTAAFTTGFTQKDDNVLVNGMSGNGALPNSATHAVVSATNVGGTAIVIANADEWTDIAGIGLTYTIDASAEKLELTNSANGLTTRTGIPNENFKVAAAITLERTGGTNLNFQIGVSIDGATPEESTRAPNIALNNRGQTVIVTTPVSLPLGSTAKPQILNSDSSDDFTVFSSQLKTFV